MADKCAAAPQPLKQQQSHVLQCKACPYKLQSFWLPGPEEAVEHHQPASLTCREAAAPPEEASPQEAAVKVLHGFTDSARNFQVQLAKAVHSPGRSSRSHQEAAGPTGFPARAAAAYLALVLRDNLSQPQAPVEFLFQGHSRQEHDCSAQDCVTS